MTVSGAFNPSAVVDLDDHTPDRAVIYEPVSVGVDVVVFYGSSGRNYEPLPEYEPPTQLVERLSQQTNGELEIWTEMIA